MPAKKVSLDSQLIAALTRRTQVKREIAALEAEEIALRNLILQSGLFSTLDAKDEGSQTIEIANYPGWKLQAKKIRYYNMTNANGETEAALYELEKVNPAIAANIVTFKPDIKPGMFNKLPPEQQELFTAALTIKPGQGSLELVEPNDKVEEE